LENILIENDDDENDIKIKLVDFGLSCFVQINEYADTYVGSPYYAAPEVLERKKYNPFLADVWSLGVIMYTMVTGSFPFSLDPREYCYVLDMRFPKEDTKNLSKDFKRLIKAIFVKADKRINLTGIEQYAWIKPYVLPTGLPEMKKVDQINDFVVDNMVTFGFDEKVIKKSLKNGIDNVETHIYHSLNNKYGNILDDNKKKWRNSKNARLSELGRVSISNPELLSDCPLEIEKLLQADV